MDFIDEFNKKQMHKATDTINLIVSDYKKMIELIKYIKKSFIMLKTLLEKKEEKKIVLKSIRQTYHVLVVDFINKINEILTSMLLLQNINVFIKSDIGKYIEQNLVDLLLFNIIDDNETINIVIDDKSFILKQKIKAHVIDCQKIPESYYKVKDDKYYSTNNMAIYTINNTLNNITSIEKILYDKINSMNNMITCTS
jgi:hypothetical protein